MTAPLATALWRLLRRDLLIAFRRRGESANPLLFFILVTALFPLGGEGTPSLLRSIAPGVLWTAALLAVLLSLGRLFRADFEEGSLEQIALSPHPLALLILAKTLAHWLTTGLPLLLVAPLLGVLLHLPAAALPALLAALALGSPALSLIGAIGAGLTVGLRRDGVLLALLLLPLYAPTLIFGAAAVERAVAGLSAAAPLYLLGALSALALTLAPLAAAAAIRIGIE